MKRTRSSSWSVQQLKHAVVWMVSGFEAKLGSLLVRRGRRTRAMLGATTVSLLLTGVLSEVLVAQEAPRQVSPASSATGQSSDSSAQGSTTPPKQGEGPKSLDDLLGTSKEGPAAPPSDADAATAREQNRRLEKALDGVSMQDLVSRAIDGMKSAADRLGESKDPGLATQRMQDDVVRTLERLLEEAKKQERKQKGSKSSSSKSGRERKPGDDPAEQNGQQQKSQSRSESERESAQRQSGDSSEENADGIRPDDAGTLGDISESRVEWGKLPERIRELVLQGRRDRVSTMYERLTREYYRRLAEEASK
jgi:hypothetical protein